MTLQECTSVRECYIWAESEWPGFWDFATQKRMTYYEKIDLLESVGSDIAKFNRFLDRLKSIYKNKTHDDIYYMKKGAGAFSRLKEF